MDDLQRLRELGEKLDEMDDRWFEERTAAISERLNDPDAIAEIVSEMHDLELAIEEDRTRRTDIEELIEAWENEGLNTSRLEGVMDNPLSEVEEQIESYQRDLNRIAELEADLDAIDTRWHEEEMEEVGALMKDPDRLEKLENAVASLTATIEEEWAKRDEIRKERDQWREEGFKTEALDEALEAEIETTIQAYETLSGAIEQFRTLKEQLGVEIVPKGVAAAVQPAAEVEREAESEAPSGSPAEAAARAVVFEHSDEIIEEFSLDSFVVGASNRFTHAAALAVAEAPAEAYNPLFIYGGVGLGKTHLMCAIGHHIRQNLPKKKVVYVTCETFTNELINALSHDKLDAFRNYYRTIDVLLIDDIQFLAGKESTQEEFFHTFNSLYSAHRQICLTSDRPPKEIKPLEERLRSRFEGGLITDIQPPSLETKIIILRRKAKKDQLEVPDEVMHLIASNIKSNIRELEGSLTKLAAYSSLNNVEITVELAEEVLKDILEQEEEEAEEAAAPVSSGRKTISSIEERLTSLKAKLSPILQREGGPSAAAVAAAASAPDAQEGAREDAKAGAVEPGAELEEEEEEEGAEEADEAAGEAEGEAEPAAADGNAEEDREHGAEHGAEPDAGEGAGEAPEEGEEEYEAEGAPAVEAGTDEKEEEEMEEMEEAEETEEREGEEGPAPEDVFVEDTEEEEEKGAEEEVDEEMDEEMEVHAAEEEDEEMDEEDEGGGAKRAGKKRGKPVWAFHYYCSNCEKKISHSAKKCPKCGTAFLDADNSCRNCGTENDPEAEVCEECDLELTTIKKVPLTAKELKHRRKRIKEIRRRRAEAETRRGRRLLKRKKSKKKRS